MKNREWGVRLGPDWYENRPILGQDWLERIGSRESLKMADFQPAFFDYPNSLQHNCYEIHPKSSQIHVFVDQSPIKCRLFTIFGPLSGAGFIGFEH